MKTKLLILAAVFAAGVPQAQAFDLRLHLTDLAASPVNIAQVAVKKEDSAKIQAALDRIAKSPEFLAAAKRNDQKAMSRLAQAGCPRCGDDQIPPYDNPVFVGTSGAGGAGKIRIEYRFPGKIIIHLGQ